MTERPEDAQPENERSPGDGTDSGDDGDYEGGGSINDPLTRGDVEAPRVPFETSPTTDR